MQKSKINRFEKMLFWDGKFNDRWVESMVIVLLTAVVLSLTVIFSVRLEDMKMAQMQDPLHQARILVIK